MATEHDEYEEEVNEYEEPEQEDNGDYVEIYSKNAIWGFTIFFSTLFGGILLMLNLRRAGHKAAATTVLLFSIGYSVLAAITASLLSGNKYIGLILNIIGGAILNEYFFKKYFPDDDYYAKPIWKPLLISVLIALTFSLIILNTPELRNQFITK